MNSPARKDDATMDLPDFEVKVVPDLNLSTEEMRSLLAKNHEIADEIGMDNHEFRFMEERCFMDYEQEPAFAWMRELPLYCEAPTQIFVHAGVDEEAGDLWKAGTEDGLEEMGVFDD